MSQQVFLTAAARPERGSSAARRLRGQGLVPAVIYGRGRNPQPLALPRADLEKALAGIDAGSTLIDLTIEGTSCKTLIREIQRTPVRREIAHVDFYEIHADELISVEVPVHLAGTPDGVRNAGGVLDQALREIEIEVLPAHIPERVELDVTSLTIGRSLHVRDIQIPNATILTDPELTVCTVVPPRIEEAPLPVAEAPVEAEPELIRKPREEEGEGEAEESEGGEE
jgi:large subunit ribosomal protein L25